MDDGWMDTIVKPTRDQQLDKLEWWYGRRKKKQQQKDETTLDGTVQLKKKKIAMYYEINVG